MRSVGWAKMSARGGGKCPAAVRARSEPWAASARSF